VNNWHVIASGFIAVTNRWARLYFIVFFFVTVIIVVNVVVAFFLEIFSSQLSIESGNELSGSQITSMVEWKILHRKRARALDRSGSRGSVSNNTADPRAPAKSSSSRAIDSATSESSLAATAVGAASQPMPISTDKQKDIHDDNTHAKSPVSPVIFPATSAESPAAVPLNIRYPATP